VASFDPSDLDDADGVPGDVGEDRRRDLDGVASLRDVEAEAGDEDETVDAYDMDDREARELDVQLDALDEPEPRLD
jgi:hypothetical protein